MKRIALMLILNCGLYSQAWADPDLIPAEQFRPWNENRAAMVQRISAEIYDNLIKLDAYFMEDECENFNSQTVCHEASLLNRHLQFTAWRLSSVIENGDSSFETNQYLFSDLFFAYTDWLLIFGHELTFPEEGDPNALELEGADLAVNANMLMKYLCRNVLLFAPAFDDGGLGARGGI